MTAGHAPEEEHDWVSGHAHEPNPLPPQGDGGFFVQTPGGARIALTLAALMSMPYTEVSGCLIVSTGHGASGPFTFGGVRLDDVLAHVAGLAAGQARGQSVWRYVNVISADGFGTRLFPAHLTGGHPILLAYHRDGEPLTREQGLVRLIVPDDTKDALRQVKWIANVVIVSEGTPARAESGSNADS